MSTTASPLTKWKHGLIVAGLAATGALVASLMNQGLIGQGLGSALGALLAEGIIYEHSA